MSKLPGILRLVDWYMVTDVSERLAVSIFRVEAVFEV
jgi:hypothetical protein